MRLRRLGLTAIAAASLAAVAAPATAQVERRTFKVIGSPTSEAGFTVREQALWGEALPKQTGGLFTGRITALDEAGIHAFEIADSLKTGTFDAAHALVADVAPVSPVIEGADLAGAVQSLDGQRQALAAYAPTVDQAFQADFDAKLLALYASPSALIWCNLGDMAADEISLKTLEGKRIRAMSVGIEDFVRGLGASPIPAPLAEVPGALEKQVLHCATADPDRAHGAGWGAAATHGFRVRTGYATRFLAMRLPVWRALGANGQAVVMAETDKFTSDVREAAALAEQRGLACMFGGPCDGGEAAKVKPLDVDPVRLTDIVENVVLKRWAARCGAPKCIETWNATVGAIAGVAAMGDAR